MLGLKGEGLRGRGFRAQDLGWFYVFPEAQPVEG